MSIRSDKDSWLVKTLGWRWLPFSNRTLLIIMLVYGVVAVGMGRVIYHTVYLIEPNRVATPLSESVNYLGFIGLTLSLFVFGLVGILAAFMVKRFGWVFLTTGTVITLGAVSFFSHQLIFEKRVVFSPRMPPPGYFAGDWHDKYRYLSLDPEGGFELTFTDQGEETASSKVSGRWEIADRRLILKDPTGDFNESWRILKCEGVFFISYDMPEDYSRWGGYLGLMRVQTENTR